jgi:hypothetical protein
MYLLLVVAAASIPFFMYCLWHVVGTELAQKPRSRAIGLKVSGPDRRRNLREAQDVARDGVAWTFEQNPSTQGTLSFTEEISQRYQ